MALRQALSSAMCNSSKHTNLLSILFCIPCICLTHLKYTESCSVAAKGHMKPLAFQPPGYLVWLAERACNVRHVHVFHAYDCRKMYLMTLSILDTTFSPLGLLPVQLKQGRKNGDTESSHLALECGNSIWRRVVLTA